MSIRSRRIVRSLALSGAAGVALLCGAATANAMDTTAGLADDSHRTAVVQLAADSTPQPGNGMGGIEDGLNQPQPQMPQQPNVQVPQYPQPGYPGGVQTQASAGSISITVAIGVGLLIAVAVAIKGGKVRWVWAVACIALGVYLSPTFVGPLVQQLGGSLGASLGNVWGGL